MICNLTKRLIEYLEENQPFFWDLRKRKRSKFKGEKDRRYKATYRGGKHSITLSGLQLLCNHYGFNFKGFILERVDGPTAIVEVEFAPIEFVEDGE